MSEASVRTSADWMAEPEARHEFRHRLALPPIAGTASYGIRATATEAAAVIADSSKVRRY